MNQDDLKELWICNEFNKLFFFHSDIDDHKDSTGHKLIEQTMMISPGESLA